MSDRTVNVSERGDVVVIRLGENVDSTCEVLPVATDFMGQGRRKFLLDLEAVRHVDSAGLARMVWTYLRVSQRGGSFKLLAVPVRVQKLLDVTKLTPVFEMFDSEDEALKSFQS